MKNELITKFKEIYKLKIKPKLLRKVKLSSEIDKLDSEIDKLYSERSKFDSERYKLCSKTNKLYSEEDKLYSERSKFDSERYKLYSEILAEFYKFDKENDCVMQWGDYDFRLEKIKIKVYNKDKTGFIFYDMKGNATEELLKPKPEEFKVIDGIKYKRVE